MNPHEVWFLLALALIIGGFGGSLIGNWWAQRQCCECCTCENCGQWDDEDVLRLGPVIEQLSGAEKRPPEPGYYLAERRYAVVLDPGPTIYPELAALADEVMDGPESHAERPVSTVTLWADEVILGWEQRFPIVRSA